VYPLLRKFNEVKQIIKDIGYDLIKKEVEENIVTLLNDKKFIRTALLRKKNQSLNRNCWNLFYIIT
jgi:hypothetical protein